MAGYMKEFVFPVIEKQLGIHVVFDGTRSLVNLEKLRADKAAPKMSVVLMDDPVMQIAWDDGLIAKLTPSAVPNLGKIKPAAVHLDGAWANYQQPWAGIAYNTKALPTGAASYTDTMGPGEQGKGDRALAAEYRGPVDAPGRLTPGDRQAVQGGAV